MANEATKVELYGANNDGDPRRYTVADGTAITKGSLMALTDPRTAILASSASQPVAGIAAESKEASDGQVSIACWTNGVFEMTASGAITVGYPVRTATTGSANWIDVAGTTASGAAIIGYALETASAGERINVRVKL